MVLKLLFWGTPIYAVPTLDALQSAGHQIVGVVTQPDRRRGRGKQLMAAAEVAREDLGDTLRKRKGSGIRPAGKLTDQDERLPLLWQ